MLNEAMREALAAGDSDGLFRGTATVPLQDGARAAEELEFAVKECGLNGAMIGSNIDGANLDNPSLDPFWKTAERLQVPLIIHPLNPLGIERLGTHFLTHIVGLLADTTVGVACLYFGGVLDRFPDLKIILCHGGGFLPYQFGRMTRGREIQPAIQKNTSLMGRDVLRWFYYDTIVFEPDVLEFLVAEVGADHVLLGQRLPLWHWRSQPHRDRREHPPDPDGPGQDPRRQRGAVVRQPVNGSRVKMREFLWRRQGTTA